MGQSGVPGQLCLRTLLEYGLPPSFLSFLDCPMVRAPALWTALLIALLVPSATAQPFSDEPVRPVHVLRAADYDAGTFVPPVSEAGKRAEVASATIEVTYVGFPPGAQDAFQFAVDIWETHVASNVPIRIQAFWEPLGEGVLGSAGPGLVANFSGEAVDDVFYALPLAESIAGRDFGGTACEPGGTGEFDICSFFNSDFPNWYLGTDGNTPRGDFDLVTVVLHEIGHGLGFTGSFEVDDGDDDFDECPGLQGVGCWGIGTGTGELLPIIYDLFTEDRQGRPLLNEALYPNPSRELGEVLQSNQVFFDGPASLVANAEIPVDLYAPSSFEPGSSFSHLDERAFPPGSPNSLMTPFLARSEAIFSPGAVTCAIFQDLGWALGADCLALLGSGIVAFSAELERGDAVLAWTAVGLEETTAFRIESRFFDEPFTLVETIPVREEDDGEEFLFIIGNLEPGRYDFRIVQVLESGTTLVGGQEEVIVPLDDDALVSDVFPNPAADLARLRVQVQETQRVRAELFDTGGRRLAVLANRVVRAQDLLSLNVDVSGLASGLYFVRVVGEEFAETRTAVVIH